MSAPVYRRWGFEGEGSKVEVRQSGRGTPFWFSECVSSLRVLRIRLDVKTISFFEVSFIFFKLNFFFKL